MLYTCALGCSDSQLELLTELRGGVLEGDVSSINTVADPSLAAVRGGS